MATIFNPELTVGLAKDAGLQQTRDKIPNQLAEKVVPVMETNPKLVKGCKIKATGNRNTTGNSVIYTTPSNQDFYLTSAQLSWIKDAASDATYGVMDAKIDNAITNILDIRGITLTALQDSVAVSFSPPLKLDRASSVRVLQSFSVGVTVISGCITGYTMED